MSRQRVGGEDKVFKASFISLVSVRKCARSLSACCVLLLSISSAEAQSSSKYDPGASDTEIKVGHTIAYSGPLSSTSEIGLTEAAYVAMINEKGGINGRKINFISLDDGYSPSKAVEQTRRLVESDEVLFLYSEFGTPTSSATQKYLNARKIPQVFAISGSPRFSDPSFPWSGSGQPSNVGEGAMFGTYVASRIKGAKVAILFQNDDFGKDYVRGFRESIAGSKAVQIVKELSYDPTDPTIDSQVSALAASGANVFLNVTTGRAAVQSIRAVANLGWRPVHLMFGPWADIESVFRPAGVETAVGIITQQYSKAPLDPVWNDDPAMKAYKDFMQKYRPGANLNDQKNLYGYILGQVLIHILREAGNELTRENINRIAQNLHDVEVAGLLPSIKVNTSSSQRYLIRDQVLTRFDGTTFVPIE